MTGNQDRDQDRGGGIGAGVEAGASAPDGPVPAEAPPSGMDRAAHKPGSRQIVLWRHGRTAWNLEGRFQGQTDIPLDEVGLAQAERAARVLAGLGPSAIVASDLIRAARTAETLARLTDLPVSLDEGLRETYAGRWQGLNDDEIIARFPEEFASFRRGEPIRRGGGELEVEVADRVVPAILRGLEKVPPGGTLVVATHGGAARVALGRMLGLSSEMWSALGGLSNCCWSILGEARRGWRLLEHNAGTLLEPVIGDDE
ncbi:broad specificity phosphatase PhoE [Catenulispora sp. GP43]